MHATDIVGYAYNADLHCITCTKADYSNRIIKRGTPAGFQADDNGIPLDAIDREGNPVHPVFVDTADGSDMCGDCCRPLITAREIEQLRSALS